MRESRKNPGEEEIAVVPGSEDRPDVRKTVGAHDSSFRNSDSVMKVLVSLTLST